jgi:hypothetical protein
MPELCTSEVVPMETLRVGHLLRRRKAVRQIAPVADWVRIPS